MSAADNKKLMEQLFARVAAGDRKPLLDRIAHRIIADGDHVVVKAVAKYQPRPMFPTTMNIV